MENICIDFGTCNTVISYYENGAQKFVFNSFNGDVLIPTTIYFIKDEIDLNLPFDEFICGKHYLIGTDALNMYEQYKDSNSYFYQFKRFLGMTKHNCEGAIDFLKKFNLNYELDDDTIYFCIPTKTEEFYKINIVQLITLFFRAIKKIINGNEILITCPAYFHDLQRQQLGTAIMNAGLNIFKMCNEPTVAIMYYFDVNNIKNDGTHIIFDLGGGTLDTTVVEYLPEIDVCDVIDIYGNNALGGVDIDNLLVDNIFEKYNIAMSPKMKFKIKNIAENIKITLSTAMNVTICLEEVLLKNGKIEPLLKITYSRHEFNKIITHLVDKMIDPIVTMAKKHETSNIIFIGGPTQIPLISAKLDAIIGAKIGKIVGESNTLYKTIVAMGGSLLYKNLKNKSKLVLLDIIPMDVGISGNDDTMITIIPKNTKFPFSASKIFTTSFDGQRKIDISIYEGISDNIINNNFIGSYTLFGIPPMEKGAIIIELTFQINENGLLNIFIDGKCGHKVNDNIKLIPQVVAKKLFKKILEHIC